MIKYGKTTQNAISAMSRLAEVYKSGERLSSAEIAESRDLPQTLVAKLLTQLSTAELVDGTRGPGGGYALARHPREISLLDVASVFERTDDTITCPFGPGWCGKGEPCPLHGQLVALDEFVTAFMRETNFERFMTTRRILPEELQGLNPPVSSSSSPPDGK